MRPVSLWQRCGLKKLGVQAPRQRLTARGGSPGFHGKSPRAPILDTSCYALRLSSWLPWSCGQTEPRTRPEPARGTSVGRDCTLSPTSWGCPRVTWHLNSGPLCVQPRGWVQCMQRPWCGVLPGGCACTVGRCQHQLGPPPWPILMVWGHSDELQPLPSTPGPLVGLLCTQLCPFEHTIFWTYS